MMRISTKILRALVLACFVAFLPSVAWAQTFVFPPEVTAELETLGVDENEFRFRLYQKGVNLEEIDPTDIEALSQLEPIVQEVLAELEEEAALRKVADEEIVLETDTIPMRDSSELEPEEDLELDTTATAEMYGRSLFSNKSIELFSTVKNVKPPQTYILGPGDEVAISIFGASQRDLRLEIDQEGYINPARIPRIYLKGLSIAEAETLLEGRLANYFRFGKGEFALSLATARTITVNIFGEVEEPGSYAISAVNTAFNALVAVGGPTEIGSLRSIQVIRGGERKNLDVYAFLQDPSVQFDYYLEEGDIIFVPVLEKVVELQGEIRRPYRYELLERENLRDLLAYGGGLTERGYGENVSVQRIAGTDLILLEANLDAVSDFRMKNGDVVVVRAIPEELRQFVEIEGPVKFPGQYALTPGLKISELVQKGILSHRARTDQAFLVRMKSSGTQKILRIALADLMANPAHPDNLSLESEDKLVISEVALYTDTASIWSEGSIRSPARYTFDPNEYLNVSDLVMLSGGLAPDAAEFAYVVRNALSNPDQTEYIRVSLPEALGSPGSDADVQLSPGDKLQVPSVTDFNQVFPIYVEGAVQQPGEIEYTESLTIQDVLTLAGGLSFGAASNRIDIFRLEIKENEPTRTLVSTMAISQDYEPSQPDMDLQPFDRIVVRNVPGFELMQTVTVEGEVLYPGPYALLSDNERMSSLVERAGGLSDEAFPAGALLYRGEDSIGLVISNLEKALSNPLSRADLIMKDGDNLHIPKIRDMLTIETRGTQAADVYDRRFFEDASLSLAWQGPQNARWYIREFAGGFSKDAKKRTVSVEYPNGRVESTKRFGPFKFYPRVEPGSTIKMQLKEVKRTADGEEKDPFDWQQFSGQVLSGATAVLTLVLLVQQINRP